MYVKKVKKEKSEKKERVPFKRPFILFCILDVLAFVVLFCLYGPISYFRNLWVTTAMTTMSHQYLAKIFYSDATIQKVMDSNYVEEFDTNTNTSEIIIDNNQNIEHYESIYEEQILKRDPGNDLYKVIDIEGSTYKGYLVAIYDPSRVTLGFSKYFGEQGQQLTYLARDTGAKVAINASGFLDINEQGMGDQPTGTIIHEGKIIWRGGSTGYGDKLIGFNQDNILVLTKETPEEAVKNGMREAVSFGPFLIVNGESAIIKGNGGWGLANRTAIGQRKDGIVLFLVIDGRRAGSIGADMSDLVSIFKRYKAHNAANLDGGASTTLVVNGELINHPTAYNESGQRWLPNAWIVK